MTEHRTSTLSSGTATMPPAPATTVTRDSDARLLKKIHAIRPMLAARERRKKLTAIPAI